MKYVVVRGHGVGRDDLRLLHPFWADRVHPGRGDRAEPGGREGDAAHARWAAVMVAVGFGYKIAAVPFHMWSPDVYEGGPHACDRLLLRRGRRRRGFAVLVRFYYTVFAAADPGTGLWRLTSAVDWPFLFAALSALTMTVGNLVAVKAKQREAAPGLLLDRPRRIHADGVRAPVFRGNRSDPVLPRGLPLHESGRLLRRGPGEQRNPRGGDLRLHGTGQPRPFAAVALAIFLFALTGIPPFSGFIGKVYLFAEVIHRGGILARGRRGAEQRGVALLLHADRPGDVLRGSRRMHRRSPFPRSPSLCSSCSWRRR